MTQRSRRADAVVVCPRCRHGFPVGKVLGKLIEAIVQQRVAERDAHREEDLKRLAAGRLVQLDKAERRGELTALRQLLSVQRAAIAELKEEARAMRKRARELRAAGC